MPDPKPDFEAMAREVCIDAVRQGLAFGRRSRRGEGILPAPATLELIASALASVDSVAVARERKRLEGVRAEVEARIARLSAETVRAWDGTHAPSGLPLAREFLSWLDEALAEEP